MQVPGTGTLWACSGSESLLCCISREGKGLSQELHRRRRPQPITCLMATKLRCPLSNYLAFSNPWEENLKARRAVKCQVSLHLRRPSLNLELAGGDRWNAARTASTSGKTRG